MGPRLAPAERIHSGDAIQGSECDGVVSCGKQKGVTARNNLARAAPGVAARNHLARATPGEPPQGGYATFGSSEGDYAPVTEHADSRPAGSRADFPADYSIGSGRPSDSPQFLERVPPSAPRGRGGVSHGLGGGPQSSAAVADEGLTNALYARGPILAVMAKRPHCERYEEVLVTLSERHHRS